MYAIKPYAFDFVRKPNFTFYTLSSYHEDVEKENKVIFCQTNEVKNLQNNGKDLIDILKEQKSMLDQLSDLNKRLDVLLINKFPKNFKEMINEKEVINASNSIIRYASILPTSSIFPIHDYKAENTKKMFYGKLLELNFCNKDSKWINALKEYAFKVPEIKFNTNNIKNAIVIKTKGNSKELSLKFSNNEEVKCIIEIWKFFGTLFGLFSETDKETSLIIEKWLNLAVTKELDELSRSLSCYLSDSDFLSGRNVVLLADIILRSLFNSENGEKILWENIKVSNNVQLWIKRVDEALKAKKNLF